MKREETPTPPAAGALERHVAAYLQRAKIAPGEIEAGRVRRMTLQELTGRIVGAVVALGVVLPCCAAIVAGLVRWLALKPPLLLHCIGLLGLLVFGAGGWTAGLLGAGWLVEVWLRRVVIVEGVADRRIVRRHRGGQDYVLVIGTEELQVSKETFASVTPGLRYRAQVSPCVKEIMKLELLLGHPRALDSP